MGSRAKAQRREEDRGPLGPSSSNRRVYRQVVRRKRLCRIHDIFAPLRFCARFTLHFLYRSSRRPACTKSQMKGGTMIVESSSLEMICPSMICPIGIAAPCASWVP